MTAKKMITIDWNVENEGKILHKNSDKNVRAIFLPMLESPPNLFF